MNFAKVKLYLNYIKYRIGVRPTIPAYFINKKQILENNSPLVNILGDDTFYFHRSVKSRGVFMVRADVVPMLRTAACALPAGYKLFFYHGFRPRLYQWVLWLRKIELERAAHPDATDAELERRARATVACPRNGFGPHQTGGAVDVTVVDENGNFLDMGTLPLHLGIKSAMYYRGITPEQKQNRDILANAMQRAGFNNYPAEWWHWSYGDRMWAAYQGKKFALYGEVESPDYVLTDEEKSVLVRHNII